jgi:hypothetical protein
MANPVTAGRRHEPGQTTMAAVVARTDRSVAGPGEPLTVYLVSMMLAPAAVTALVLWGPPSIRRYFG